MPLCWKYIAARKSTVHISCLLWQGCYFIDREAQFAINPIFLPSCGVFFLKIKCCPSKKKKKKKYFYSEQKKQTQKQLTISEQSPISCRLEILNSIYHPGARSSSALPLLPRWGEQRGLDAVTERFLAVAVCMQGRLKEAYALLRLAKKHLSTRTKRLWSERRRRLAPGRLLGNPRQRNVSLTTFWNSLSYRKRRGVEKNTMQFSILSVQYQPNIGLYKTIWDKKQSIVLQRVIVTVVDTPRQQVATVQISYYCWVIYWVTLLDAAFLTLHANI